MSREQAIAKAKKRTDETNDGHTVLDWSGFGKDFAVVPTRWTNGFSPLVVCNFYPAN